MTERKLMEAQYQAAIEAYKKVSRTRIDDSSRAVIAAIAEHVQVPIRGRADCLRERHAPVPELPPESL